MTYVVFIAGAILVLLTLNNIVRAVIVPRGERVFVTRLVLAFMLLAFKVTSIFIKDYKSRDSIFARLAPLGLMLLPMIWAISVALGFSGMFWALGTRPYVDALILSGSSLTTLGFRDAVDNSTLGLAVGEALLGLSLVALVVSYLPTIYSVFRSRELKVSSWGSRAGSPPQVENFIYLANEIGLLDRMNEEWVEWEHWFVSIGESHLSYPALNFFRSPSIHNSWIATAGSVLDTAAFLESSTVARPSIESQLCIQSGYVALRQIADYYKIKYDADPAPDAPISYKKEDFMKLYDKVEKMGVPLKSDREQAWVDFAGWRVNYDTVLVELDKLLIPHHKNS